MTIQELYESLDDFLEKWPDKGDLKVVIDNNTPVKSLDFNCVNFILSGSDRQDLREELYPV